MTKEFPVETGAGDTITDITNAVQEIVSSGRIGEGLCVISSPHTTVGITVNENYDPDVKRDMLMKLVDLIPREDGYRHMEGNSAAHLKATITGISVTLPVIDGRLALGRWQGIYFCDYDGPRRRRVRVTIVGS